MPFFYQAFKRRFWRPQLLPTRRLNENGCANTVPQKLHASHASKSE